MPMNFVRTSQDADSNTPDACCGHFVGGSRLDPNADLPADELAGNTVYCCIQCTTCGALHRDGFLDGYTTDYEYQGVGDPEFDWVEFDWEYSHIDDNKLHDGRAVVVYTPANNPIDDWVEYGDITEQEAADLRADYDPDNYQKRETYVYRFSEVDRTTVSPVAIGAEYEFHAADTPTGDTDAPPRLEITDLDFADDWTLTTITAELIDPADPAADRRPPDGYDQSALHAFTIDGDPEAHADFDALAPDTTFTFTPAEFRDRCDLIDDPYGGIIDRRPSLPRDR